MLFGIVTLFLPARLPVPDDIDDTGAPSVAEGSVVPPAPRPAAASPDASELVRIREIKRGLERRLDEIMARVGQEADPDAVEQAEFGLEAFRALFVPALVAETEPGVFRYAAIDPCQYENCFTFIVAERFSSDGSVMLAAFSPERGSLTVHPAFAEPDGFQPYLVLHELVYVSQVLAGIPVAPPAHIVADAAVPAQTNAHWVESVIMNASTGGRYGQLLAATAERVLAGDIEAVRSRKITFVAWPEALYDLFEDHGRTLSLGSRSGLLAQATLDLNHSLIDLAMPQGDLRDLEHEGVYANFLLERQDPAVTAFNLSVLR